MRKILLFFLLIFSIYNTVDAWRYKVSSKTYSSNSWKRSCPSWTYATKTNGGTYVTWSAISTTSSAGSSGTFYCYKQDTTRPSGSVSYSPSSWTTSNVTVRVSCSDSWAWCAQSSYSRVVSSNRSWYITIKDNVWNTRNVSYNVTNIDNTAPTWTVSYKINWTGRSYSSAWWVPWTKENITVYIECSDWWSWCSTDDISGWTRIWRIYSKIVSWNSSWDILIKDNLWNNTRVYFSVTRIDKTYPIITNLNITWWPSDSDYFKAVDNQDIEITITPKTTGESPIVWIKVKFEKTWDNNQTIISEKTWSDTNDNKFTAILDISKVDHLKNNNNYRDYKLTITEVEDDAWNVTTDIWKDFIFHVYANIISPNSNGITILDSSSNEITSWITATADWEEKNIYVKLEDENSNSIVPVRKKDNNLLREVKISYNYDNSLLLDQTQTSWTSWIDICIDNNSCTDVATIWTNQNISKTFSDKTFWIWWIYELNFFPYSPTLEYWKWEFKINNFSWTTIDNTTGIQELWKNGNISFNLKPLYSITLSWATTSSWFIDWTQTTDINIIKNGSTSFDNNDVTDENHYFLKVKKDITWDNYVNNFNIEWKIDTQTWTIKENNVDNFNYTTTSFENVNLHTNINRTSGFVNQVKDIKLNHYLNYVLNSKNITYKGSEIWTWDWVLNKLKIYWITNIDKKKQENLVEWQDEKDIQNINWEITKSILKKEIRKNTINLIKVVEVAWTNQIIDLSGDIWNDSNWGTKLGNILYFWNQDWNIVEINSSNKFVWKKTIVVIWWDLYIESNIINENADDILWIIVLKDENWKWWKLYIDNDVWRLDAAIYVDKSVIWYDWVKEIGWDYWVAALQKQLYINWSIFSENTIWGSIKQPDPVCPYWVKSISWFNCTVNEAKKYDLNYLRYWYEEKEAWSWNYPVVIKYNPELQSGPPPLFDQ